MIKTLTHAIVFTVISILPLLSIGQVAPTPGEVLITEVSRRKVVEDFIELYNTTSSSLSLSGCKLIRYPYNDTIPSYIYDFDSEGTGDTLILANNFLVVGRLATLANFNSYWGVDLSSINSNYNNSNILDLVKNASRYSLQCGGTNNVNDGTKIDSTTTIANNSSKRIYQTPIGYFTRISASVIEDFNPGSVDIIDDFNKWDIVRRDFQWFPSAPTTSSTSDNVLIQDVFTLINDGVSINDLLIYDNSSLSLDNESITISGDLDVFDSASLCITGIGSVSVLGVSSIYKSSFGGNVTYNIWSSPFNSGVGILTTFNTPNPCDVLQFEASTQRWKYDYSVPFGTTCAGNNVNFTSNHVIPAPEGNPDGDFDKGRGYFGPGSNSNPIRIFSSSTNLTNGDFTVNIYGSSDTIIDSSNDWNLLGNPYPSGLRVSAFVNHNPLFNAVQLYNGSTGMYEIYNSTDDFVISSCQGFFIDASSSIDGVLGNCYFKNNDRRSYYNSYRKSDNSLGVDTLITWMSLTSPSMLIDKTRLYLDSNSLDQFDVLWDANKLTNENSFNFSTVAENHRLAINGITPLTDQESKIIPLYVQTNETGLFEIKLDSLRDMPLGMSFYLEDKQLNTMTNLRTNDYSFNSPQPDTLDDRFFLHLSYDASITTVDEVNEISNVLIYAQEDFIQIKNTDVNQNITHIQVYDIVGKLMVDQSNSGSTAIVPTSGYQSGIYIVKTIDQDGNTFNKRVFVK